MSAPVAIATSDDRQAWLAARRTGVTATDVAKLGPNPTAAALRSALAEKRGERAWGGNASTQHGTLREPEIAKWVTAASAAGRFGSGKLIPSHGLFAHPRNERHLATPDGMSEDWDFFQELLEIKTTNKAWSTIPRHYLRQVWWQQYVLGAERTLVVWEQHEDGVPVDLEPRFEWVKRNQAEIDELRRGADTLLRYMDDEAPLPPSDVDRHISRYLRIKGQRDALDERLAAEEKWLRDYAGDKPLTVLGTRGDLSIGAPSEQVRFDSAAFKAADPDTYSRYQKAVPVKARMTIKAVEAAAEPAEDAA